MYSTTQSRHTHRASEEEYDHNRNQSAVRASTPWLQKSVSRLQQVGTFVQRCNRPSQLWSCRASRETREHGWPSYVVIEAVTADAVLVALEAAEAAVTVSEVAAVVAPVAPNVDAVRVLRLSEYLGCHM